MKIWKYKLGISEIGEVLHTAIPVVFLKISWVTKSKYSHDLETLLPRDRFTNIPVSSNRNHLLPTRVSQNPKPQPQSPHHQFPV